MTEIIKTLHIYYLIYEPTVCTGLFVLMLVALLCVAIRRPTRHFRLVSPRWLRRSMSQRHNVNPDKDDELIIHDLSKGSDNEAAENPAPTDDDTYELIGPPPDVASVHIPTNVSVTDGGHPAPEDLARRMVDSATHLMPYRRLSVRDGRWQVGLALHTGYVRDRNEDYAIAFDIDDITIAVKADGCGGRPFGQTASLTGVTGAAVSVIRQLAWRPGDLKDEELESIALQAVHDASIAIQERARRMKIDATKAMRSTLILAIVTENAMIYAYIGDGGGYVWRTLDESLDSFVIPQKLDGSPHVLTASLGATIEGRPESGILNRVPGDLVWICSDGVADRTDPEKLGPELLRAAIDKDGDLGAVARDCLEQFACYREDGRHVFDDNMSLILIGDEDTPGLLQKKIIPRDMEVHSPSETTPVMTV